MRVFFCGMGWDLVVKPKTKGGWPDGWRCMYFFLRMANLRWDLFSWESKGTPPRNKALLRDY